MQEYFAACTFIFSQRPYDIGDKVSHKDNEVLVVIDIHLAYTTFRSLNNGRESQIRHSVLCGQSIENLSRSNLPYLKDRISIKSEPIPRSQFPEVEKHLNAFVQSYSTKPYSLLQNVKEIRIDSSLDDSDHCIEFIPAEEKKTSGWRLYVDVYYKPRVWPTA